MDKRIAELIAQLEAADEALTREIGQKQTEQAAVRASLSALRQASDDEPAEFVGKLADAVRMVLRQSDASHSPLEVREALGKINYDLSKHDNPMAAIHSVLKRMVESPSQDVKTKLRKDGTTAYYWVGERTLGDVIANFESARMGGLAGLGGLSALIAEQESARSGGLVDTLRRVYAERDKNMKASMKGIGGVLAPKPPTPIKTLVVRPNKKSESED